MDFRKLSRNPPLNTYCLFSFLCGKYRKKTTQERLAELGAGGAGARGQRGALGAREGGGRRTARMGHACRYLLTQLSPTSKAAWAWDCFGNGWSGQIQTLEAECNLLGNFWKGSV